MKKQLQGRLVFPSGGLSYRKNAPEHVQNFIEMVFRDAAEENA